ncbi:hypothetical protein BDZ89DRAFT_1150376 [Hymenopellis radicata]|nr:hypothetical protein BDZ89DRAFT_1150376 [Hymenopellis radicata]
MHWYAKPENRARQLAAMQKRYDKKAAKEGKKRRAQGPREPEPAKLFDELLCKRLLRRAREMDASRRIAMDSPIQFARETVRMYEGKTHEGGCTYVLALEEHYRGQLEAVNEMAVKLKSEAGEASSYFHDCREIVERFKVVHDYLVDIWFYVERYMLQTAKKQRRLLYQQA